MIIDVLAVLGVLAIAIGVIDIFATESVGIYIIGLICEGITWGMGFVPLSAVSDDPKLEVPPLNRYEHPVAFWFVFVLEVSVGGILFYPWIHRWIEA